MLSYQVVAVTVGWHIYEVTRNPFSLGLIGLAEVLPFFCVAPFAGYLVDHLAPPPGHGRLLRTDRHRTGIDQRGHGLAADRRRGRSTQPLR